MWRILWFSTVLLAWAEPPPTLTVAVDIDDTLTYLSPKSAVPDFVFEGHRLKYHPHVREFLQYLTSRPNTRVVFFSATKDRARVEQTLAPFADLLPSPEIFTQVHLKQTSQGPKKDLSIIPNAVLQNTLLVDNTEGYVAPGQKDHWIPVLSIRGRPSAHLTQVMAVLERMGQERESSLPRGWAGLLQNLAQGDCKSWLTQLQPFRLPLSQ